VFLYCRPYQFVLAEIASECRMKAIEKIQHRFFLQEKRCQNFRLQKNNLASFCFAICLAFFKTRTTQHNKDVKWVKKLKLCVLIIDYDLFMYLVLNNEFKIRKRLTNPVLTLDALVEESFYGSAYFAINHMV